MKCKNFLSLSRIRNFRDQILYTLIFFFHFTVGWFYTREFIHNDTLWVVINQIEKLERNPELLFHSPEMIQYNFYTGNPFFFIPLFELVGFSPSHMRAYLIGFMALSSVLAYIIYRQNFDFKESLMGILILLNFNFWTAFRYADYTYSAFFCITVFLIYEKWYRTKKTTYLFLLAFLSGILFYFKAMIGYFIISVLIAHLLSGRDFSDMLDTRKTSIALLLFILGAIPALVYGLSTDFQPVDDLTYSIQSNEDDLGQAVEKRLKDITLVTNFNKFPQLDWPANIEMNAAAGLLPLALLMSIYRSSERFYSIFFIVIFSLFLLTPNGMRWRQIVVLLPFISLVLIAGYSSANNLLKEKLFGALTYIIIVTLLLSLVSSVSVMDKKFEQLPDYEKKFGGSAKDYKEYERLDTNSEIIVTNSYKLFVASKYDSDLEKKYFIIDSNHGRYIKNWTKTDILKTHVIKQDYTSLNQGIELNNTEFLLINGHKCDIEAEFCGTDTEKIQEYYNLSIQQTEETFDKNISVFVNSKLDKK